MAVSDRRGSKVKSVLDQLLHPRTEMTYQLSFTWARRLGASEAWVGTYKVWRPEVSYRPISFTTTT
jgi:hypothetical protein